ncbi:hypothetical protein ELH44_36960 [Rhizobium ruizarguesonis]|nr:hypothetical protein ELH44_36960 [Rhizobium ruizarguesonis]
MSTSSLRSVPNFGSRTRPACDRLRPTKTCQKLGLSFWHYLGDRLGIGDEDHLMAPLASLVAARA